MEPVQVRITKKLIYDIDRIIDRGRYPSRSEFIREAIRRHVEDSQDLRKH